MDLWHFYITKILIFFSMNIEHNGHLHDEPRDVKLKNGRQLSKCATFCESLSTALK